MSFKSLFKDIKKKNIKKKHKRKAFKKTKKHWPITGERWKDGQERQKESSGVTMRWSPEQASFDQLPFLWILVSTKETKV